MLESVEKMFPFALKIPKFFIKDIDLKIQKEKFVTYAILNEELSVKFLISQYIELFKELIIGFNPSTEDYIKMVCSEKFTEYSESLDMLVNSVRTRVHSYLIDLCRMTLEENI